MENIDEEALKKNRKAALVLGFGAILFLVIITSIILRAISDQKTQLITAAVSQAVLVAVIIITGKYRKRKMERDATRTFLTKKTQG